MIKSGEVLSMFDSRGRQLEGWTNKLIWGDNKLVLSSLINGPLRDEIEREGGLKLIYIDPPFAVGADFGFDIQVGGDSVEKKQSVIEEIAYRDTWGKGISSYLTMMYERLKLMHSLLAEDGSIYVHCDWRVNSHIRLVLDDVFGSENFLNEIIWRRRTNTVKAISNKFSINTDTIFLYTRQRNNYLFNIQYGDYPPEYYERFKYEDEYGKFYWNVMATYSQERLNQLQKEGKVKFSDGAKHPRFKQYLHELKGRPIENVWDDVNMINAMGGERLAYPTQKPEALLERIIKASSNEGDLIADFFSGSGTTAAVAEKLGRKWIATDLGRFAIHTARKRLIGVQRELQKNDKNFRAFEILNLGKYERQFFINDLSNGTKQEDVYLNLILEAYKAKRIAGHTTLHGSKAGRFVHVGPLDVPVTQTRLQEIFTECQKNLYTQVDVLGFEFEMGLTPQYIQELREKGVSITLKYIPKEVFDKRAIEKKQVNFYDVAYLNAKVKKKGKSITVQLTDFVTYYSQDDIEELQQTMRAGSKVVIENGQIIKIDKSGDGIINRTLLTQNWHDWIDYWAIDFNYEDKQEIIKIKNEQGETEAIWSGNYLFENEWQSFRTKKEPTLEFTSIAHEYKQTGKYKIMVKVVDILGIDTSKIIEVKI